MTKRIFLVLLLSVITLNLAAVSIDVKVSSGGASGEPLKLIYFIDSEGAPQVVSPPSISGATLLEGPITLQSNSYTSVINGNTTRQTHMEIAWLFQINKSGEYNIKNAVFRVDGRTMTCADNKVKVTGTPGESRTPLDVKDNEISLRVIPNRTKVYEQEPILCTVKLICPVNVAITDHTGGSLRPKFDGFIINRIDKKSSWISEDINGQRYRTLVVMECMLFPQKSGNLKLEPLDITLQCAKGYRNAFGGISTGPDTEVKVRSNEVSIEVMPLPSPRPEGFNGAVGDYKISSHLMTNNFAVGQASSLVYTITGSGNIKYLKDPTVKFPDDFETYAPKGRFEGGIDGNTISGTYTIDYQFIPRQVGDFTIPAGKFVYFNPEEGKYITLNVPAYPIKVEPGNPDDDVNKAHLTDILPIVEGVNSPSTSSPIAFTFWYWLLYLLFGGGFVFGMWYYHHQQKLNADTDGRRKARAEKAALNRLSTAKSDMESGRSEQFYTSLLNAIQGYISDKLSIPASQLSRDNISAMLLSHGASEDDVKETINIIEQCEMARYTPPGSSEQQHGLYDSTLKVINKLETTLKK